MQARPLRDFEQGAHLHVLDWTHDTARYRFQAAGATQVRAASKAFAQAPAGALSGPPELPSLEAAVHGELRKLYAVGHMTVRSEIDHQRSGSALPVGLSIAPAPPNLRKAKAGKGKFPHCATCRMFDSGMCWGYGNYPVKPNQLCDSYAPDPRPKTLAIGDAARDPGRLRVRARLVAQAVSHAIWQAIQRARLLGVSDPKRLRLIGREAGNATLGQQASHHAGGAINSGRHGAALTLIQGGRPDAPAGVIGARYTSVLDKATCGPCAQADTGQLIALGSPLWIPTPNPACLGGDRCRCIHVYQLGSESGSVALPIAAGR
jgi:hypothetical protein